MCVCVGGWVCQVHILQRLAFKYYKDQLMDLAFASSQVRGSTPSPLPTPYPPTPYNTI
jgi:hypothetical protein